MAKKLKYWYIVTAPLLTFFFLHISVIFCINNPCCCLSYYCFYLSEQTILQFHFSRMSFLFCQVHRYSSVAWLSQPIAHSQCKYCYSLVLQKIARRCNGDALFHVKCVKRRSIVSRR